MNEVELMRQQLTDHQRVLEEHTEILKHHTEQIKTVTDIQQRHDETIQEMNQNYMKLENTIFRENKETRDMMRGTMDKQFTLIEQLTGFRESASVRETDLKRVKMEKFSDVAVKFIGWATIATGSGGAIFILIDALVNK